MQRVDEQPRRANPTSIIVGLVFLTLGAFLLLDQLELIPIALARFIFTWQSLLIGIGLICLIKGESRGTGLALILVGGAFLAGKVLGHPLSIWVFFWPVVFIGLGLLLILNRRRPKSLSFRLRKGVISADEIEEVVIFGGSEQAIGSRSFRGGSISNIFGGSTFDLSAAELAPGPQTLDLFCLFGGSKIIVPPHWHVKLEVTAIFGGYTDKRRKPMPVEGTQGQSLLVLRGVAIFGGGEIKCY